MVFITFIHTLDSNVPVSDNIEDTYSMLIANPPYQLTLPLQDLVAQDNGSGYPLRPQNAFILFRKDLSARLRMGFDVDKSFNKFSKKVWEELPDASKQFFEVIALNYNKIHKEKYPNYNYHHEFRRKRNTPQQSESTSQSQQRRNDARDGELSEFS